MLRAIGEAVLFVIIIGSPVTAGAQVRGTPAPTPATPAQPQRGQRATAAKPPMPLTLRQVIEALQRTPSRVDDQVSKAGVQFQATPAVLDILKQFGASTKLIAMIPPPPAPALPAQPPPPKTAGTLTIICEPKDCNVVVDDHYVGSTTENKTSISGLRPKETTIQIFADGYDHISRRVVLEEGKPAEEKFTLNRSAASRDDSAKASLMKTLISLGGVDGLSEFADVEGDGSLQWMSSGGTTEQWAFTFNKHSGKNLTMTFKTKDGQCTGSVTGQTAKQDCKGGLKNSGEKIAEQATSLFLSYQLQDVLQALLHRSVVVSEKDTHRLESGDAQDSYVLINGNDALPTDLVYQIGNSDPIHVQYANYLKLTKGLYPGKISVGRLNAAPAWVFSLNNVRSRVLRSQ